MNSQTIHTKQVIEQTQVNRETLRFYERQGLIAKPRRSFSGYRMYPPDAIPKILFIKRAKQVGFSLKEIKRLLGLKVGPSTTCDSMKDIADQKIAEIQKRIHSLQEMKRSLESFRRACAKRKENEQCNFINHGWTADCCREEVK